MNKITLLVLTSFYINLLCAQKISSQNEQYIYKIRIPKSENHPKLIQTGFKLANTKGIITALHGVADGKIFSAQNSNGTYQNLYISYIDIAHDLALLTCEKINEEKLAGFSTESINKGTIHGTFNEFSICGYPEGTDVHFDPISILPANGIFKKLPKVIGEINTLFIHDRNSPSDTITIIDLNGSVAPGQSGAPLLNKSNNVIGIIDGGSQNRSGWAIPIYSISWKNCNDPLVAQTLSQLGKQKISINQLFALQLDIKVSGIKKIVSPYGIGDFRNLDEAIKMSQDGDTLLLKEGNFFIDSMIRIDKSITLIGEDKDKTFVSELSIDETSKLSISNITLTMPIFVNGMIDMENCKSIASCALKVDGGTAYVSNCVFQYHITPKWEGHTFSGVGIEQSYGFVNIRNSIISDFHYMAIKIEHTGYISIEGCSIKRNDIGIWASSDAFATISKSNLNGNRIDINQKGRTIINPTEGGLTTIAGRIVRED